MARRQDRDWQAPSYEASATHRLGWVKECAIDEGWAFVKSQVGFSDIQRATNVLLGKTPELPKGKWPPVNTNRLKRNTREIIETLANIRPFWGYSTDNKAFMPEANMLNKLTQAIYLECFVDRSLRDALQFAATSGVGFISPQYVRRFYGKGEGYFKFEALGRQRVLPVQLPDDKDYQEAYAVTLVRRFGVAKAHALFPDFQDKLKPTRSSRYGSEFMGGNTGAIRGGSFRDTVDSGYNELACDIFYTYILDLAINETKAPLKMGFENKSVVPEGKKKPVNIQVPTPWSYEVPYLGQQIPKWNAEKQKMELVAADEQDCRIYPQRRLMISCDQALMYDGPGFDWHGMVPLVPLYMDDWVFSKSGLSIMRDGLELQGAIVELERSMLRMARGRVNPSKQYAMGNSDLKKIASRSAEAFDPFDPDTLIGVDGDALSPVFGPALPEWMTQWGNEVPQFRESLMQAMDYQMGINDIESLAKLRVMGGDLSGLEKLIEAQGPVVMGVSRSMERSMRDLGEMFKYMVLQYMTTARVIQYVGADGVTPATLDYHPNSIVPSHLPHEDQTPTDGLPPISIYSRTERAKFFAENLRFYILPHSLHEITQNQQKLIYLNLSQRGGIIDNETLCNALSVPNYGTLEGSTIQEKLQDQKWKEAIFAAKTQLLLKALGLIPDQPPQGPPQPAGAPQEPPHEATGQPEGRPPTYSKPPRIEQKGVSGNGRTVVSTSG